jgi:hypothetical protein
LLVIAVLLYYGVIPGFEPGGGDGGTPWSPTPGDEEPEGPEHGSAKLQWTLRDGIGGTALTAANEYVDTVVAKNGVFDFTEFFEQTDNAASSENTDNAVSENDAIIMHASSDADLGSTGTDYYDMFYCIFDLKAGEDVYVWTPDLMEVDHIDGDHYYYKFKSGAKAAAQKTGYTITWSPGTTPYWAIGTLKVYPRAAGDDITFTSFYSGAALSTITDGSTWDTTTTGAADKALTSTDEVVTISLEADATNIAYGIPQYTLTKGGKIETRPTYLMMSTNMTAISVSALAEEKWYVINDSGLTSEMGFYREITQLIPTKGDSFSTTWALPVDSSAAASSSGFYFKLWLIDMQLPDNVKIGHPSTTIPTAHGFLHEFGLDAIIYARAFASSSGVAGNQVLSWVMSTP